MVSNRFIGYVHQFRYFLGAVIGNQYFKNLFFTLRQYFLRSTYPLTFLPTFILCIFRFLVCIMQDIVDVLCYFLGNHLTYFLNRGLFQAF